MEDVAMQLPYDECTVGEKFKILKKNSFLGQGNEFCNEPSFLSLCPKRDRDGFSTERQVFIYSRCTACTEGAHIHNRRQESKGECNLWQSQIVLLGQRCPLGNFLLDMIWNSLSIHIVVTTPKQTTAKDPNIVNLDALHLTLHKHFAAIMI